MTFKSPNHQIVLLSDHVSLANVRGVLSAELIENTVLNALNGFSRFFDFNPSKVIFSGINPHAGESGILGDDDSLYAPILNRFRKKFSSQSFIGPLSGDTLFNWAHRDQLLVYAHHDQGLAPFKAVNQFLGANITFGLDFLRMSVDHGTASDNYGKNISNPMGCLYCLQLASQALGK